MKELPTRKEIDSQIELKAEGEIAEVSSTVSDASKKLAEVSSRRTTLLSDLNRIVNGSDGKHHDVEREARKILPELNKAVKEERRLTERWANAYTRKQMLHTAKRGEVYQSLFGEVRERLQKAQEAEDNSKELRSLKRGVKKARETLDRYLSHASGFLFKAGPHDVFTGDLEEVRDYLTD